jgi:4-hydroxy-4-methyl-2-oxoglutarate aldolase
VIDAGGCLQTAVVGEHLCGAARRNGVAGLIANAAVRDIGAMAAWPDFPVFALGNTARGPVSIERGTVGAAIVCGGVRVAPHDLILADDDGVVAIPRAEAASWLEAARAKVLVEAEWDRRLSAGETTLQVFRPPTA